MAYVDPCTKVCEMEGVREYNEGDPVELWLDRETGRLVIRARNECLNNCTDVDLEDLLGWLIKKGAEGFKSLLQ